MERWIWIPWYFVGMMCTLGLVALLGITSFVILLVFQSHLTWGWFLPVSPSLVGLA